MSRGFLKESLGSRIFDVTNVIMMLLLSALMIYPFINLIAISLNDGADAARGGIFLYPRVFSLDSYSTLFHNDKLIRGTFISILRVVAGTVSGVLVTGMLAYIVTINGFSGRKCMRILFIIPMFINGGLIPTYLLILKLGLLDTFTVYLLPTLINGFYMLIIASYFQNLPEALFDSARIDGASELRIYFQIVLPVSIPVFAAISIFVSVYHWNSWFDVMVYNPSGKWDTLQTYLRRLLLESEAINEVQKNLVSQTQIRAISPITLRAATTVLVTVPIICVYPFFQKYFVGGITLGSVKG
jgi:putative aldouronate transport system permease protein